MLEIYSSLSDINISLLKRIYAESIEKNATELYASFTENLQMINAEQDFYADLQAFFKTPSAKYAVLSREGRYVTAVRVEQYRDGFLITGLETAPEARQKGCASELIRLLIAYFSDMPSIKIYSHIDNRNQSSLRVHQKNGFLKIEECAIFVDGSFHNDFSTYLYDK